MKWVHSKAHNIISWVDNINIWFVFTGQIAKGPLRDVALLKGGRGKRCLPCLWGFYSIMREDTCKELAIARDSIDTIKKILFCLMKWSYVEIYEENISYIIRTHSSSPSILVHCKRQLAKEELLFLVPHIPLLDDGQDTGLETTMQHGTIWKNLSLVCESLHLSYYSVWIFVLAIHCC